MSYERKIKIKSKIERKYGYAQTKIKHEKQKKYPKLEGLLDINIRKMPNPQQQRQKIDSYERVI